MSPAADQHVADDPANLDLARSGFLEQLAGRPLFVLPPARGGVPRSCHTQRGLCAYGVMSGWRMPLGPDDIAAAETFSHDLDPTSSHRQDRCSVVVVVVGGRSCGR